MARAGLNKHLVQQARDAIRARGQHPSLDAVRIELGNTGSKTTIHRYLKELEEEEGTRLDDVGLLSETLKEMVGRLAARLHEEAHTIITAAATQHATQVAQLQTLIREQQARLEQAQEDIQATTSALGTERTAHQATKTTLQQETLLAQRLEEQVRGLETRLQEGETHRQSLEEKHQHAREALEHYRQSVKEQREQDQRRHETQVQQLQAELRQLQQTLAVKQGDITQLNRDNERLATELRDAQRQAHQQERLTAQLEMALKTTQATTIQIESMIELSRQEMAALRVTEAELRAELQEIGTEKERLADLLDDVDIARIIQARHDGKVISITIGDPISPN
ncbi:MAG: DNA-binding protein [Moraxellaceae bacterium]|nr:DNA-binding protein [Moraxellaceae bacterium]